MNREMVIKYYNAIRLIIGIPSLLYWGGSLIPMGCARAGFGYMDAQTSDKGSLAEASLLRDQQVKIDQLPKEDKNNPDNMDALTDWLPDVGIYFDSQYPLDTRYRTDQEYPPDQGIILTDSKAIDHNSTVVSTVSKANDTCSSPAIIDLIPLSSGETVTFTLDTNGANLDYNVNPMSCSTYPDVVVQFINFPGSYNVTCTGGGSICATLNRATPTVCPPPDTGVRQYLTVGCGGGSSTTVQNLPQGTVYLTFYRDPSLAPATVILSLP